MATRNAVFGDRPAEVGGVQGLAADESSCFPDGDWNGLRNTFILQRRFDA